MILEDLPIELIMLICNKLHRFYFSGLKETAHVFSRAINLNGYIPLMRFSDIGAGIKFGLDRKEYFDYYINKDICRNETVSLIKLVYLLCTSSKMRNVRYIKQKLSRLSGIEVRNLDRYFYADFYKYDNLNSYVSFNNGDTKIIDTYTIKQAVRLPTFSIRNAAQFFIPNYHKNDIKNTKIQNDFDEFSKTDNISTYQNKLFYLYKYGKMSFEIMIYALYEWKKNKVKYEDVCNFLLNIESVSIDKIKTVAKAGAEQSYKAEIYKFLTIEIINHLRRENRLDIYYEISEFINEFLPHIIRFAQSQNRMDVIKTIFYNLNNSHNKHYAPQLLVIKHEDFVKKWYESYDYTNLDEYFQYIILNYGSMKLLKFYILHLKKEGYFKKSNMKKYNEFKNLIIDSICKCFNYNLVYLIIFTYANFFEKMKLMIPSGMIELLMKRFELDDDQIDKLFIYVIKYDNVEIFEKLINEGYEIKESYIAAIIKGEKKKIREFMKKECYEKDLLGDFAYYVML